MRHSDAWMTVARLEAFIDCLTIVGHCNRSVMVALSGRSGDFPNTPRNAVIRGHNDGLVTILMARLGCSSARIVRHVNGPIGRDFDMTMQAPAVDSRKHDRRGTESKSTVIAASAAGIRDALRGIVDRLRINRSAACKRWREGTAADCLVVDVRWKT